MEVKLTPTQKLTYEYIVGCCVVSRKKGLDYAYCGHKRIAEVIGVSVRTVCRVMKQLIELGLIRVERVYRCLNSRTYIVGDDTSEVPQCHTDDVTLASPLVSSPKPLENNIKSLSPVKNEVEEKQSEEYKPRRPRLTKWQKLWRREEIKKQLMGAYHVWDSDYGLTDEEDSKLENTCGDIATYAATHEFIRCMGADIAVNQFIDRIQTITHDRIMSLMRRLTDHEGLERVKNPMAYICSCFYNEAVAETTMRLY